MRMLQSILHWLQCNKERKCLSYWSDMGGMVSSQSQKHMKIFKARTLSSADKYGVACRNLRELKEKGWKKFQLPPSSTRVCLYEDGTEVSDDEYLWHLSDNTELMLLTTGQTWRGSIDWLLNSFYTSLTDVPEAARRLLSDEQAPKTQKILIDFVHNLDENISAENREEDEPWFEGIESRFKNKSSYMRFRCESRIRGYMKEVQNSAASVDPAAKEEYNNLIEALSKELKAAKYNGCYFNRMEHKANRLCTEEGWFSCQGAFDVKDCTYRHSINPYSNRESRILFSTWNLDHRIEKSRAILPCLLEAVKESRGRRVNHPYFFDLLFTTKNLKLVHIACHKKTSHSLSCDQSKIYTTQKRPRHKKRSQRQLS
ncbi:PREDICTED: DNA fragmentation factor subunit beta [Nanorana parkeri]|uniref:DNA fragmentation factor subunit beta n=1 Tax=Nanorana parkeri TaxID=125878 RepID=UPI000854B28C|nr:PREDICTED: DNA fragmentation factor subunit beta [Nanorana parkeri]